MKVAIIGGGWAGLSAAVRLAGRGFETRVIEASRHLGGRARRVTLDGVDLDNGQHVLIGAYSATLEAMRASGAPPESLLRRVPLQLRYVDGFRMRALRLPHPLNLAAALLCARGLGLAAARKAVRFISALNSPGFLLRPDRSVEQWLAEQDQDGVLRTHLWEPLCVSALNTPVKLASAQVFAGVLRAALTGPRGNSDLLIPCTDLGRLFPEPAAAFVRSRCGTVELGAPVRRISRRGEQFLLDGRPDAFDRVIIATAPQHVAALLEGFPELGAQRRWLAALSYEPITTCYLQYAPSLHLPSMMLGFTGGIVQWAFDRGQLGGPPGLIAAVISASGPHADLPNDALGTSVHRELASQLAGIDAPRWTRVITERRATYSCRPALEHPGTTTAVPGLLLAGDYLESELPGTLESAARSGKRAADVIAEA